MWPLPEFLEIVIRSIEHYNFSVEKFKWLIHIIYTITYFFQAEEIWIPGLIYVQIKVKFTFFVINLSLYYITYYITYYFISKTESCINENLHSSFQSSLHKEPKVSKFSMEKLPRDKDNNEYYLMEFCVSSSVEFNYQPPNTTFSEISNIPVPSTYLDKYMEGKFMTREFIEGKRDAYIKVGSGLMHAINVLICKYWTINITNIIENFIKRKLLNILQLFGLKDVINFDRVFIENLEFSECNGKYFHVKMNIIYYAKIFLPLNKIDPQAREDLMKTHAIDIHSILNNPQFNFEEQVVEELTELKRWFSSHREDRERERERESSIALVTDILKTTYYYDIDCSFPAVLNHVRSLLKEGKEEREKLLSVEIYNHMLTYVDNPATIEIFNNTTSEFWLIHAKRFMVRVIRGIRSFDLALQHRLLCSILTLDKRIRRIDFNFTENSIENFCVWYSDFSFIKCKYGVPHPNQWTYEKDSSLLSSVSSAPEPSDVPDDNGRRPGAIQTLINILGFRTNKNK